LQTDTACGYLTGVRPPRGVTRIAHAPS